VHCALGEGDLEAAPLLDALAHSAYTGDVIIQGHGLTGDISAQLRRSVNYLGRRHREN
jgi:sugar phosphate isomerase/epimerase